MSLLKPARHWFEPHFRACGSNNKRGTARCQLKFSGVINLISQPCLNRSGFP
jgi:hypothetical protein